MNRAPTSAVICDLQHASQLRRPVAGQGSSKNLPIVCLRVPLAAFDALVVLPPMPARRLTRLIRQTRQTRRTSRTRQTRLTKHIVELNRSVDHNRFGGLATQVTPLHVSHTVRPNKLKKKKTTTLFVMNDKRPDNR